MISIRHQLVAFCVLCAAALMQAAQATADDPRMTPLVKAVQTCRDFVVNIHTVKVGVEEGESRFFTPKSRRINGMGTGIVVDERGYIVTNYHVIHDVDEITVTLIGGETLVGRPVSFDRKKDMAIIHVQSSKPLTVMNIGTSSDIMLAEQVFAVGNAFGYEFTVTEGIVSALGRDVEVDETQAYENLIQTDASINPGNSGGPLLNVNGEVIGINVAIRAGAQRIGFAIPIDDARRTVARLLSTERLNRVSHGVFATDVKSPGSHRLIVDEVAEGSAGAICGLKKGDCIQSVRGLTVRDNADWERALLDIPVGKVLDVEVNRGGKTSSLKFTVGIGRNVAEGVAAKEPVTVPVQTVTASAAKIPAATTLTPVRERARRIFGLQLAGLTPRERQALGRQYNGGLSIVSVARGSLAEAQGVRAGDILLGLDGFETLDDRNLTFILDEKRMKSLTDIKFTIFRDAEALEGYMTLPATAAR
ncbi:MAG: trypsin-like peptidase domain-containing protein [Planctomycetaceae bacterium]